MTYLQLVNDVLVRLRETSVASVTTTTYSTLIGKFVNDAKKQVEDAWFWNSLSSSITVNTTPSTSNYVVTGSGRKFRGVTVNNTNTNSKYQLQNAPLQWIVDQQDLTTTTNAQPRYYAWNGDNGVDSKVEFYPTPDASYAIKFHMTVAQSDLSADGDILLVPSEPVVASAYARALVERGEDGSLNSSEAYMLYKNILSDAIAMESTRYCENDEWVAV